MFKISEYISIRKIWLYVLIGTIAVFIVLLGVAPHDFFGETTTQLIEEDAIEMAVRITEDSYTENGYAPFEVDASKAIAECEDGVWYVTVYVTWNGFDIYNRVIIQPVQLETGA